MALEVCPQELRLSDELLLGAMQRALGRPAAANSMQRAPGGALRALETNFEGGTTGGSAAAAGEEDDATDAARRRATLPATSLAKRGPASAFSSTGPAPHADGSKPSPTTCTPSSRPLAATAT